MEIVIQRSSHPEKYHKFVLQGMETADQLANGDKDLFLELFKRLVKDAVLAKSNIVNKTGW